MTGKGFLSLSPNMVAVISYNNATPAMWYGSTSDAYWLREVSRTDTQIVFEGFVSAHYNTPSYLGLICRERNGEIWWTNESRPLP